MPMQTPLRCALKTVKLCRKPAMIVPTLQYHPTPLGSPLMKTCRTNEKEKDKEMEEEEMEEQEEDKDEEEQEEKENK